MAIIYGALIHIHHYAMFITFTTSFNPHDPISWVSLIMPILYMMKLIQNR